MLTFADYGVDDNIGVAVLMSGGVDSSVAAALLQDRGFKVVGFTLKLWDAVTEEHTRKVCCSMVMARDAGEVCSLLGIPHYTLDLRQLFYKEVIVPFEEEYLNGRTPNPCVRCNSRVKWRGIVSKMEALGLRFLATGHYAQIVFDLQGNPHLIKARDNDKDQSYFLWEIPKDLLKRTIFPLGGYRKNEVRHLARQFGLPVADKEESQEVCFVPGNDYREWLEDRSSQLKEGYLSGVIINKEGRVLAQHKGYPYFTIGQRKGLGISGESRYYVKEIIPITREVVVAPEKDLWCSQFIITDVNYITKPSHNGSPLWVKVRYRDRGTPIEALYETTEGIEIKLLQPAFAIAPGQSAVVYQGDEVILGGIIKRAVN